MFVSTSARSSSTTSVFTIVIITFIIFITIIINKISWYYSKSKTQQMCPEMSAKAKMKNICQQFGKSSQNGKFAKFTKKTRSTKQRGRRRAPYK